MPVEKIDVNNTVIQSMIVMQLLKMNRQGTTHFVYQDLENYIDHDLWKESTPDSLHEAADQIMHIRYGDVIGYLSGMAKRNRDRSSLKNLVESIGGVNYD